jgi:hypothetical protein
MLHCTLPCRVYGQPGSARDRRGQSGRASQAHHDGQEADPRDQGKAGFPIAVVGPLPKEYAAADMHAV